MPSNFLAGLAGGLQGLGQGLDTRYQRKRQARLDALDQARIEAAIQEAQLQMEGMRASQATNARQDALMQKSPADLLGGAAPAGVPWVPTQNQSTIQDIGPLASLPMEAGSMVNPYIQQGEAERRKAHEEALAAEDRARLLGPQSPELQRITGFQGTREELKQASPFILENRRLQALLANKSGKGAGGAGGAGGANPDKIKDNIAVQEEYRKALDATTTSLIADAALSDPKLADALRSARGMAAAMGRAVDPNMVFDAMDPNLAASIRSRAAMEAMLSTVSLLPGTSQNNPQMVQSLIDQVPAGTGRTQGLPRLRQGVESLYGAMAPQVGFTYGEPDTLLYGGTPAGGPPAQPAAPVPLSSGPATGPDTIEGISKTEYLQFRAGEGATPQQAEQEWAAYAHAVQATSPQKPLVTKKGR